MVLVAELCVVEATVLHGRHKRIDAAGCWTVDPNGGGSSQSHAGTLPLYIDGTPGASGRSATATWHCVRRSPLGTAKERPKVRKPWQA